MNPLASHKAACFLALRTTEYGCGTAEGVVQTRMRPVYLSASVGTQRLIKTQAFSSARGRLEVMETRARACARAGIGGSGRRASPRVREVGDVNIAVRRLMLYERPTMLDIEFARTLKPTLP
jgi:hypothetical protein